MGNNNKFGSSVYVGRHSSDSGGVGIEFSQQQLVLNVLQCLSSRVKIVTQVGL